MSDDASSKVQFHYIKSNYFRSIHADGAWGGTTPRGYIHASFYSERGPIPRTVVHEVKGDKTLGPEVTAERIAREGLVREVEVEVIFDLATAKSFREWLDAKIKHLEDRKAEEAGT